MRAAFMCQHPVGARLMVCSRHDVPVVVAVLAVLVVVLRALGACRRRLLERWIEGIAERGGLRELRRLVLSGGRQIVGLSRVVLRRRRVRLGARRYRRRVEAWIDGVRHGSCHGCPGGYGRRSVSRLTVGLSRGLRRGKNR